MDRKILEALEHIPVADLTRQDWIAVGMALKEAGFDCSVWDEWSKNDSRYKPGECQRKWAGFRGSSTPIKAGTIIQMATGRGWRYHGEEGCMDWNDEIADDGNSHPSPRPALVAPSRSPADELITYLETLFEPDDYVAYVSNDVWLNGDKWVPGKGAFDRTASQLIAAIKAHPDDLGAVLGDWKPEAGAWIRFNPVDGTGVKNENVTRFRYCLVESDTMTVDEQNALYRKLELPIACLVHSGGKSLHAIVRVDAQDEAEYRKRVDYLYDYLGRNGVVVDRQNRNPSRLSRMPGVTRNGNRQYLVEVNIGRKSWADWADFVEGAEDNLPELVCLADYQDNIPPLAEELIKGILRRGHKMLLSGSSKAGKSFLLMQLCIAIAEGGEWLSFPCRKGRVLYVNLEIDEASCINRFDSIYKAMGTQPKHMSDIMIWPLRGKAVPLDKLLPRLIRRVKDQHFDAIIIDPIYKVITGDENNATEMAYFCNQFDAICAETGCATIYCHHHSKGAQGAKRAMDRASGSGVFARDPDAQLDMIQLEVPDTAEDEATTAWRLESSLREFPNIRPVNFWFDYPIHRVDNEGSLDGAYCEGSFEAMRSKNRKYTTPEERRESVDSAFQACSVEQPVTLAAMAEYMGVTERCVRDRLKETKGVYWCRGGLVGKNEQTENR